MEKIRELLGKIGASDKLANDLCEEFERYTKSLKTKYDTDLRERLETSKKVCIEEVQREKVNLARKVGTYLESKALSIEQAMTRQRVVEESEATSVLKKAKAILEDIQIDESGGSRELLALQKKAGRLEKAIGTLREERDRAVSKANKANDIALKTLDRNRLYENKLVEAGLLAESKGGEATCECGSALAEGKTKCEKCSKIDEGNLPPEFLENQKGKKGKDKADDKADDKKDKKDDKVVPEAKQCTKCQCDPCECADGTGRGPGRGGGRGLGKDSPGNTGAGKGKNLGEGKELAAQPKSTRRTLIETVARKAAGKVAGGDAQIDKIASEMPE